MEDWTISRENAKHWDLAYSFGAFLGDGWLDYQDHGHGAWFVTGWACMDRDIIERVQEQVNANFNRNYKLQEYALKTGTRMYKIAATCQAVYFTFMTPTKVRTIIPEAFRNAPIEVVRELIAGLFDTDGSIRETQSLNGSKTGYNTRWQLSFGSTSRELVEDTAALLQRHGVKVGKIGEETRAHYKTVYKIQPNLRSFLDAGFYFCCQRKAERLRRYLGIASETLHTDAESELARAL